MKTALTSGLPVILAVVFFGAVVRADEKAGPESAAHPRQLWAEMQQAVLQTQDVEKVEAILHAGFDVNAPIGCGTLSAVDGAVSKGDVKMLAVLLKAGAKPTGAALVMAAFCVNPDAAEAMVRQLIKAGADANSRGSYGETALASASYRGNAQVVEVLLAQPHLDLNAADHAGTTALMEAVSQGRTGIVRRLLEKGADSQMVNDRHETAAIIAGARVQERRNILELVSATPAVLPATTPAVSASH